MAIKLPFIGSKENIQDLSSIELVQAQSGVAYLDGSIDAEVLDLSPTEIRDGVHKYPRTDADVVAEQRVEGSTHDSEFKKWQEQEAAWAELRPKAARDLADIIFHLHGVKPEDDQFASIFEPEFSKIRMTHTSLRPIDFQHDKTQ